MALKGIGFSGTAMTNLPVYALPGLLSDSRVWRPQVAALSAARPVRIADLTQNTTIAALASHALRHAPDGRFALMGWSMGGYVALEIIRQAPERVAALALVDTGARADTPEAIQKRRAMMAAPADDFEAVLLGLVPQLVHPSRIHDRALIEAFLAMARAVGRDAFLRQQEAIIGRPDSRPFLRAIRSPTLVLCGRDDLTTPLALSEEMAAAIDGAKLVVVERCGHLSTLERPDDVTSALDDWLASVPGL